MHYPAQLQSAEAHHRDSAAGQHQPSELRARGPIRVSSRSGSCRSRTPGSRPTPRQNPSQFPAGTTGIFIPIGQWRPYFVGGNPFFGGDNPAYQTRDQDQFRVSAGLSGAFSNAVTWDANASYGRNRCSLLGFDFTGVEIELALRGLGGEGCNWQTGTPGVGGCEWLNPMSNAIAGAPRYGVPVNPGYDASVAHTEGDGGLADARADAAPDGRGPRGELRAERNAAASMNWPAVKLAGRPVSSSGRSDSRKTIPNMPIARRFPASTPRWTFRSPTPASRRRTRRWGSRWR